MRHALLTLFLALPASAQDTVDWSGTGCRMVLTPDKPHVAEITCLNRLTGGVQNNEGALSVDGFAVGVVATMFPGDVPDEFVVIPPEGYVSVPPALVLDEHARGVAVIREWVGM